MHIYQTVINRLEECRVPLTQWDKSKIQAYRNGLENDEAVKMLSHMSTRK